MVGHDRCLCIIIVYWHCVLFAAVVPTANKFNYGPSIGQEAFLCLKETCKLIEIGSAFIVALGHKLRVQVCCELACSSALQFSSNVLNMLLS